MTLRSLMLLTLSACVLAAAGPALGQGFGPAPQPSQGFGAPQQEPPCLKDFVKLRDEAQKKGAAVSAAATRHATPGEACKLLSVLTAAEVKLVKFAEDNLTWCGIPPQVVEQLKNSHLQTEQVRSRVCTAAAQRPASTGPSLSDALGTNRVPDASNIKSGRGTYDTLTGTPLGK